VGEQQKREGQGKRKRKDKGKGVEEGKGRMKKRYGLTMSIQRVYNDII